MGMVCKSYASVEDLKKISMAIAVAINSVVVGVRKVNGSGRSILGYIQICCIVLKFFIFSTILFSLFFCEFLIDEKKILDLIFDLVFYHFTCFWYVCKNKHTFSI
ncbi:unnamed protein product [Brassica rapa subsp. trilocularis]